MMTISWRMFCKVLALIISFFCFTETLTTNYLDILACYRERFRYYGLQFWLKLATFAFNAFIMIIWIVSLVIRVVSILIYRRSECVKLGKLLREEIVNIFHGSGLIFLIGLIQILRIVIEASLANNWMSKSFTAILFAALCALFNFIVSTFITKLARAFWTVL